MDGSLGECIMRAALQELFPTETFVKTRQLTWLSGLELDCYCEKLRLAFEYQGIQHYQYVPFFHNNDPQRFEAQQVRDQRKREAAHDEFVVLVEVPHTVPYAKIRNHVFREVSALGYSVVKPTTSLREFLTKARADGAQAVVYLEKARSIARSHKGVCTSDVYIDCHTPLDFICAKGHHFQTPLASVNARDHSRPRFCPECGGTRRRTFEENEALVKSAGYTLLDVIDRRTGVAQRLDRYLVVRCPAGHEYEVYRANFAPVVDGKPKRGCVRCARTRTNHARGEQERRARAREWGIEMTGPFVKRNQKTTWMCANGHEFQASWNTVLAREKNKCLLC